MVRGFFWQVRGILFGVFLKAMGYQPPENDARASLCAPPPPCQNLSPCHHPSPCLCLCLCLCLYLDQKKSVEPPSHQNYPMIDPTPSMIHFAIPCHCHRVSRGPLGCSTMMLGSRANKTPRPPRSEMGVPGSLVSMRVVVVAAVAVLRPWCRPLARILAVGCSLLVQPPRLWPVAEGPDKRGLGPLLCPLVMMGGMIDLNHHLSWGYFLHPPLGYAPVKSWGGVGWHFVVDLVCP